MNLFYSSMLEGRVAVMVITEICGLFSSRKGISGMSPQLESPRETYCCTSSICRRPLTTD